MINQSLTTRILELNEENTILRKRLSNVEEPAWLLVQSAVKYEQTLKGPKRAGLVKNPLLIQELIYALESALNARGPSQEEECEEA